MAVVPRLFVPTSSEPAAVVSVCNLYGTCMIELASKKPQEPALREPRNAMGTSSVPLRERGDLAKAAAMLRGAPPPPHRAIFSKTARVTELRVQTDGVATGDDD